MATIPDATEEPTTIPSHRDLVAETMPSGDDMDTPRTRQGHIAQGFPGLVEGLLMRQIVHACVRQKQTS